MAKYRITINVTTENRGMDSDIDWTAKINERLSFGLRPILYEALGLFLKYYTFKAEKIDNEG